MFLALFVSERRQCSGVTRHKSMQCSLCTLVLLWLVLIGSKDLDGGETSDAILAAQ